MSLRAPAPLRWALGTASRLAPEATAGWAERRFLTPIRPRRTRPEPEAWSRAVPEPLPFRGLELAGWRWGEGEPSVWLVHGWSGSARQLGALAGPLERSGVRVLAWDLPAHGDSPGRTTNLVEIAEVLEAAAERFGPPAAIVAHSLGAAATSIALARGLPARRVALLAPPAELDAFGELFAGFLGLSRRVRWRFQDRIENRLGARWRELAPERLAAGLGAVGALLVHDLDDREVPVEQGRRLAAAWPGSRLVVTAGLGHNRILRDPGVVARVCGFVAGREEGLQRELAS